MILIVDDRPENILPLKKILELHDFETDSAESGEEALKKILKTTYSVIIMDVQMPGMDGFEVAEAIAGFNKAKDTPIIFLSAVNTEKRFITKGYSSGGIDYLTKPVDPDILLLKVKTFYKLYEQQQELKVIQESLRREIDSRKRAQEELAARMEELRMAHEMLEQKVQIRTSELTDKNSELETTNHELQQFAWVVSHDLKEPLRKIQTFSQLIKDKYLSENPEATSYLNRSINSSARMSRLISDLLDYSRLSVKAYFQPTDLYALVNELLLDFDEQISEKNAVIHLAKLPVVDTIPSQIRQVFQNLISNALKFSKPDVQPVINITCALCETKDTTSPESPTGRFCRISIEDNGIGFNEKFLDRIFIIFQRLNNPGNYEGTGIGLAIAKKIMDKHNGLISAHSMENQGAKFVLVLPLEQDKPQKETQSENQYTENL
ncbi:hybrid sensor histidine kinase/response regulator [Dyadobacter luticola]|uniref:histidine kinase n=1 Tax=Dyadobacter luticola TaxID=1979387 RepID=A0A5R9L3U0_9BACT|nr:hybrid sensor histidine kinase/response regulator [Dyadobacter luticola]TLV03244.1 response regulator [Dyadobacter luticola]